MAMLLLIFKILVVLQLVFSAPLEDDDLIVTLSNGKVQGKTLTSLGNTNYYGFQGIPYGKPPVKSLRFEAPQPAAAWSGVLDATKERNVCVGVQYWENPSVASEDCLYVNVYTPSIKPQKKLPVMIWIYGGSFILGDSLKYFYGPDYLMAEDVVFVSFNYRLASFGFLSTGDSAIHGNAGLKDQLLALKWTKDNIAHFGGDPENIVIFGESAGAESVGFHLVSDKSAGLFKGAIAESGSALDYSAIDQDPKKYAYKYADKVAGKSFKGNTMELKAFLKEKSMEGLINASIAIHASAGGLDFSADPMPVLEVESSDAFLTKSPYSQLESGNFNKVPLLIGITSEESLMFLEDLKTAKHIAASMDAAPVALIPKDLGSDTSNNDKVIKAIQKIYLKNGETFSSNLVALARYVTDNEFSRSVIKHAELTSKHVQVYLYQFAYYGRPFTAAFIDGAEKAGHIAELPFIFNNTLLTSAIKKDILTQQRTTRLWANFARNLNPTPSASDKLVNVVWPTYTSDKMHFLNINNTLEVRQNLRPDTYSAWNNIYQTYGKKPFITY